MQKILTLIGIIFVATVGLAIYFSRTTDERRVTPNISVAQEPQTSADYTTLRISTMSLDEKIGQMLIVGFDGTMPNDHIRRMIEEYHIGGINLLKRNVQSKKQVQQLTSRLQQISKIPLFLAADQEGGQVIRFNFLKELTPQIKIKETHEAESVAFARANELRDMGINMNFSPVLDYVSNRKSYLYSRTFGANPPKTGDLGNSMIKGYVRGGVIPVAKHFPGYGNVSLDPHTNQATLSIQPAELELNLIAFQRVIANNSNLAIMTAHIVIPVIDTRPATKSPKFLTEILRKELGFAGVIITDDMNMASAGRAIEQSAVDAIKAGADVVIITANPEVQVRVFNRLKNAVLSGEVTEERINESVGRILNLKLSLEGVTQ